jgi:hypothetical protein
MSFVSDWSSVEKSSDSLGGDHVWGDSQIAADSKKLQEGLEIEEIARTKASDERWRTNAELAKTLDEKRVEEYVSKHGEYWKYGFGDGDGVAGSKNVGNFVYVPIRTVRHITSRDKVNQMSLSLADGGNYSILSTLLARGGGSDFTFEEYCDTFCEERDGAYYVTPAYAETVTTEKVSALRRKRTELELCAKGCTPSYAT